MATRLYRIYIPLATSINVVFLGSSLHDSLQNIIFLREGGGGAHSVGVASLWCHSRMICSVASRLRSMSMPVLWPLLEVLPGTCPQRGTSGIASASARCERQSVEIKKSADGCASKKPASRKLPQSRSRLATQSR